MSRCLTEYELQAVADDEAPAEHRTHVEHCAACAERVDARRQLVDRVAQATASVGMAGDLRAQLRTGVMETPARGATTLRDVRARTRWAWGLPLAAAAAVLVYFVVVPGIDRRTTVSAAEVLGRSQAALSAPLTGLEFLSYDLEIGGALGDLVSADQAGRFTVQELIDHDHDGRYKIVKLDPSGRIVGGAADDSVNGTRTRYLRVNGRGFLLRFDGAAPTALSIVALKRSALQLFIALMQTSATPTMREFDRGDEFGSAREHCYEITIPGVTAAATPVASLDRARAVVTSADARLVEFSAAGTLAGQPFTIDFGLRVRMLGVTGGSPGVLDFDIAPQEGDVLLHGDASGNPMWDVLTRVLDALPASGNVAPGKH